MTLIFCINIIIAILTGAVLGILLFILYCKKRKPLFMKDIFIDHKPKGKRSYYSSEHNVSSEPSYNTSKDNSLQIKKELDDTFMNNIHHSKSMGASILFSKEEESELDNFQTIEEYCKNNSIQEDNKLINDDFNIIQENSNSEFSEKYYNCSEAEVNDEHCDEIEQLSFDEYLMNNNCEQKNYNTIIKRLEIQSSKKPKSQVPKINIVNNTYKDKVKNETANNHKYDPEKQGVIIINPNNRTFEATAAVIKTKTYKNVVKKAEDESFQIKVPIVSETHKSNKAEITSIKEAEECFRTKKLKKEI